MPASAREAAITEDVWAVWERLAATIEPLSPFLLPDWYRALERRVPRFRPSPRLLEIDGKPAVLPLAASRWHLGTRVLESGPWATYGGFLSEGRLLVEPGAEFLPGVPSLRAPTLRFTTPPGFEILPGAPLTSPKETHLLDITPGYVELHDHIFTRQMRAGIRKAQEQGVHVEMASSAEDDEAFLRLYQLSRERWGGGTDGFPDSFLDGWSQESGDFARLWLARLDDRPVAGVLVLYGRGEAHYMAGAGDQEAFHARPNHLLFATVIADARDREISLLNLGSSGGIAGVERFKRQLGARPAGYVTATYDHTIVRRFRKFRRSG